jgi:3-hydroxyisobutyrate dehydrogenase-like beta-hydroxyacid dehydrogenase
MKVGFVGLGSLGGGMARRLARSGFELIACDINPETLAGFDEPGAEREADPVATARKADVLCVCVRMDADLEALTAGGAIFAALGEGGLFIVHSTVAPDLCRRLAIDAKRHGVELIDAGVSGGAPAALEGGLSIYVGGEDAAVERARPVLECYGKSVLHLGPVGRGMEGKLLNNLVSIANYGMSAAILDLGEKLNFDREQLRQALMAGSADGFALKAVPGLLRNPGPMRELLGKDLAHARELAAEDDVSMAALVRSAESLLDRLGRAAGQS